VYIREAHARETNLHPIDGVGEDVHIGIIDSASSVPDYVAAGTDVNQGPENAFIATELADTQRHGTAVFRRASAFAPEAEYSLYQAVNSNRRLPLDAYADAVSQAIEDSVDVVNLSAGAPWRHPIRLNPNVPETERLLDAGIIVVAAAGNYFLRDQHRRPPVHCPSAADGVVSVASLEVWCPQSPGQEPAATQEGPYFWQNPQNRELLLSTDTFCGEQGCVGGESCEDNQRIQPWSYNPTPTDGKPDTLAPMHTLRRKETASSRRAEYLGTGTSFSAPLVTGEIACILSELKASGHDTPDPYTLQSAVRETNTPIESSLTGKLDAHGLRDRLWPGSRKSG